MKITDNRVDELNKRILLKTYKCKKKKMACTYLTNLAQNQKNKFI